MKGSKEGQWEEIDIYKCRGGVVQLVIGGKVAL